MKDIIETFAIAFINSSHLIPFRQIIHNFIFVRCTLLEQAHPSICVLRAAKFFSIWGQHLLIYIITRSIQHGDLVSTATFTFNSHWFLTICERWKRTRKHGKVFRGRRKALFSSLNLEGSTLQSKKCMLSPVCLLKMLLYNADEANVNLQITDYWLTITGIF